MKINYLKDATNLQELKSLYFKLAKQHHPDCGGSTEIMQIINAEYEYLKANLKNAKNTRKAEQEIIDKLNELSLIYEIEYQRRTQEKEKKEAERIKKIKLDDAIYNLYTLGKAIILKNKNSYTCFKNGLRYALGEGKSGKYINCDYCQFYDLIIKKNINDYYILAEGEKTYGYTNKELKELTYVKILVPEAV